MKHHDEPLMKNHYTSFSEYLRCFEDILSADFRDELMLKFDRAMEDAYSRGETAGFNRGHNQKRRDLIDV